MRASQGKTRCALSCVLVGIMLSSHSVLAGQVELQQTLDFKWRGLNVATMQFAVSLSVEEGSQDALLAPMGDITLIGETKGPLSWIQDYQATVSYTAPDPNGASNVFNLEGMDNGEHERRRIVFADGELPRAEVFEDSTAPQPLKPREQWRGNTLNPIAAFGLILQAAASGSPCGFDTWGYDGKRRYRLVARDDHESDAVVRTTGADEQTARHYICSLTLYAQGRETANSQAVDDSKGWRGRFAKLWPFSSDDRELIFSLTVEPMIRDGYRRIHIQQITIPTPIGAITAKAR